MIEVKPKQPLKAPSPIDVTLWGMLMEVKTLKNSKEFSPIVSTPSPIDNSFKVVLQSLNQLPTLLQFKDKCVILVQPEKALLPMDVTLLPMVTEVKPEQPEKA